jgi:2-polyprenyl-6-methoxyphenol hydroxylase-like FAD-dependent oxidoreductase
MPWKDFKECGIQIFTQGGEEVDGLGILTIPGWAYDTQAIVAAMNHQTRGKHENPNTVAYQRFLPTGPITFLPLSPTVSSTCVVNQACPCKSPPRLRTVSVDDHDQRSV